MDVDTFWRAYEWPQCTHCRMPAVFGNAEVPYFCGWHGTGLMIFSAPGADGKPVVWMDLPDEVPWIRAKDEVIDDGE